MAGFLRGGGSGGAGGDRGAYGRVGGNPYGDGQDPYRDSRSAYSGAGAAPPRGGAGFSGGAGFAGGASGAGRAAYGAGGAATPPSRSAYQGGGAGFATPPPASGAGYGSEKALPPARSGGGGGHLIVKCPEQLVLSNCVVVNPQEWGKTQYILIDGRFVFTALADNTGQVAPRTIGTALLQRQWAGLSAQGHEVSAEAYDPFVFGQSVCLGGLDLELAFLRRGEVVAESFDADEMQKNFLRVSRTPCRPLWLTLMLIQCWLRL